MLFDESVDSGEVSLVAGVTARMHSVITSQARLTGHSGSVEGGSLQCTVPHPDSLTATACKLLALYRLGAPG